MRKLKLFIYRLSKLLGLFALARYLTRRKLRVLCYHGVSIGDEHLFRPGLFMRAETIRGRFETLTRAGYPVLPLDTALENLATGNLPHCAVVVTYDDGFYGNFHFGPAIHEGLPVPATIYVTTYYVVHPNPIYRLTVQYMFWKTRQKQLSLEGVPGMNGETISLSDPKAVGAAIENLIRYGEAHLDEPGRVEVARQLGARLGVDYDELATKRGLSLVTPDEIRALAGHGFDIQLHTHRHQLPDDKQQTRREIVDNRAVLEPILGRSCDHFCYPSGVYYEHHWPWLAACGIKSAVTCEVGLNDARTPRFRFQRFLDSETVSPIEFEAELSGFAALLGRLRFLFRDKPSVPGNPQNYGR